MARDAKFAVAVSSLLWAVVLTVTKLIVGLITGSLGILSEALHSGIDLAAAGVTVFAVVQSARPADDDHQFGHGKFENLSALFETLLLVGTSAWIIREAVLRLLGDAPPTIAVTPWSFAVMAFAIVVNLHRSRALGRAARDHRSQALEADALHFSSDVLGSAAVIAGLAATALGLAWADAAGALAVAVVILVSAARLIRRSVDDLLDRAPAGAAAAVRDCIHAVPGVSARTEVRVRPQGSVLHVDAVVRMDGRHTLEHAHDVATDVETAVRAAFPGADVNVHLEPDPGPAAPPPRSAAAERRSRADRRRDARATVHDPRARDRE
jgi:cation diffusion facilitator family transporter